MHFCRICRTESNLKYTTKQLRHIYKRQRTEEHKQLLNTTPTLGNICHDCEERLQNFHHLSDDEDDDLLLDVGEDSSEVDVDGSSSIVSSGGRSRGTVASQRREESPVIVDDDDLLYNLFFQKEQQRRKAKQAAGRVVGGSGGAGVVVGGALIGSTRKLTQQSLGSDGDTEIIEVLTSRENTPTPAPLPTWTAAPLMLTSIVAVPAPHQNVVAVIDLETEEDALHQALDSDDEQIVFCSVEPELFNKNNHTKSGANNNNNNNKKCRKAYAERELRLIASLSLVSSDDESEAKCTANVKTSRSLISNSASNAPTSPTATTTTTTSTQEPQTQQPPLLKPLIYACTQCSARLPDAESLQIHERIHTNVCCPVCTSSFSASQRLVHHMRRKHRTYEGSTLAERPRCAQDSAMTIRLRYLERYTYYECQLCGRIDAVFKEHKEHVMHEHAAESKSLKDPMMKELRCPICKEKCSTQHVQLVRHLLSAHTPAQYRPHIREVTHTTKHKFDGASPNGSSSSGSHHKDLQQTARIFQLTKRRSCFFECRACAKVVAGYLNHIQHMKTHVIEEKGRREHSGKITAALQVKAEPPTQLLKNAKTYKNKKDKVKTAAAAATVNNKPQQPPQTNNNKPNHTSIKSVQTAATAAAAESLKKQKQRQRQLNKLNKKAQQSALLKVKVKPPLRQFRAQKYKCKHCQNVLKGFHRLNLHLLASHAGDEYRRCGACSAAFTTDEKRVQHELQNHQQEQRDKAKFFVDASRRQKRKRKCFSTGKLKLNASDDDDDVLLLVDENCNTASSVAACKRARLSLSLTTSSSSSSSSPASKKHKSLASPQETLSTASPLNWLQDLLQLQQNNNNSISSKTTNNNNTATTPHQCRFCTQLLRTALELSEHEAAHAARQEIQLIKRCALGTRISL